MFLVAEWKKMNKTEFTDRIAEKMGKTKKDAGHMVDVFLQTISEALQNGEKVTLIGFGNFEGAGCSPITAAA
jgi:DNA-binding protein HU-beta